MRANMITDDDLKKMGGVSAEMAKTLVKLGIPAASTAVMIRYILPSVEDMVRKKKGDDEILKEIRDLLKQKEPQYSSEIETKYREAIAQALKTPEVSAVLRPETKSVPSEVKIEVERMEDLLRQLGHELNTLTVDYRSGKLKKDAYEASKAGLQEEIDNTKQRLTTVRASYS
jgi:hypothetical protein